MTRGLTAADVPAGQPGAMSRRFQRLLDGCNTSSANACAVSGSSLLIA